MTPRRTNDRSSTERKKDLLDSNKELSLAMRPCERCSSSGHRCQLGESSEKCIECIRLGKLCDLAIPPEKLRRVHQKRIQMRKKVKEAKAKWFRLECELEKLETEEEELVAAEWQNISKKEIEEKASLPAFDPIIPFDVLSEQLEIPPGFDFSGLVDVAGTVVEASGSSQDS